MGGALTFQSGTGTAVDQEGVAAVTTATAGLIGTTPPTFYAGNYFSFYWRGFVSANSNTSAAAPIIAISDHNSWSPPYIFMGFRANTTGTTGNGIVLQYNGGSTYSQFATASWTTGKTNSCGGSFNMTQDTQFGYVNGVSYLCGFTNGTKTTPAATSQICLACEPAGGDNAILNADVYCAYFYTRNLSDTDQANLDADPYGFLIWPEDEIFATLVGAAAAVGPVNPPPYPQRMPPFDIRAQNPDFVVIRR
jgi:hypothetical protein